MSSSINATTVLPYQFKDTVFVNSSLGATALYNGDNYGDWCAETTKQLASNACLKLTTGEEEPPTRNASESQKERYIKKRDRALRILGDSIHKDFWSEAIETAFKDEDPVQIWAEIKLLD
jgi:hypothetical protein